MKPRNTPSSRPGQSGFMLIEVLVAMLIFAVGILAVVNMQLVSIKQSGAAKYRTDASLLANELIGRMWAADRKVAQLQASFGDVAGAGYLAWLPRVQATLPNAVVPPPVIDANSQVTISISWKAPNEAASDPIHNLTVVTQIK